MRHDAMRYDIALKERFLFLTFLSSQKRNSNQFFEGSKIFLLLLRFLKSTPSNYFYFSICFFHSLITNSNPFVSMTNIISSSNSSWSIARPLSEMKREKFDKKKKGKKTNEVKSNFKSSGLVFRVYFWRNLIGSVH